METEAEERLGDRLRVGEEVKKVLMRAFGAMESVDAKVEVQ